LTRAIEVEFMKDSKQKQERMAELTFKKIFEEMIIKNCKIEYIKGMVNNRFVVKD